MTTDQAHAPARPTAPKPEGRGRRWPRAAHRAVRGLRHSPVTLVYVAALWIIALVTGSVLHGPAVEPLEPKQLPPTWLAKAERSKRLL